MKRSDAITVECRRIEEAIEECANPLFSASHLEQLSIERNIPEPFMSGRREADIESQAMKVLGFSQSAINIEYQGRKRHRVATRREAESCMSSLWWIGRESGREKGV